MSGPAISGRRLAKSPAWSRGKSVLTVSADGGQELWQLEEGVGLGQLFAHREQDPLLALGAVEIGLLHPLSVRHLDVALAAPGIRQRGDAVVEAAARLEDQALVRLLVRQASVEAGVDEAALQAQLHAADRVDHAREAGHVDERVVMDLDAEVEADRTLDRSQAAGLGARRRDRGTRLPGRATPASRAR